MKRLFPLISVLVSATTLFAKEQEFRFDRPDAQSVALMCEGNDWKAQPMIKGNDGVWKTTLSLNPGTYGYKFLVNGNEWVFDPNNANRKTVNGIENSAIEITADTSAANAQISPPMSVPATPTTSTAASGAFAPTPGEVFTIEIPLSDKRRADAAKDGDARVVHARLAICVPQNFDSQKSWPILVISNTEAYSNIDSLQQFKQAANDEGWIALAADAVESEKNREGSPRWPTIGAAFDYITAQWPGIKDWPVACGGMSGGAKNSAFLAADLAREHHRIIGMLMMGCNQDQASVAFRKAAPPNFLAAAVFLSSGKHDTIATPAQHEYVKNSLRSLGFQKVRLESFDGAHEIYQPHIGEALRWFVAQGPKISTTPTRSSDWDKFFKKP